MMFPTLDISATTQQYRYMTHQVTSLQSESLNHPEENDETLGEEPLPSANSDSHSEGQRHSPASSRMEDRQHHDPEPIKSGYRLFQPFLGLPEGYSLSTPFHSCSYRWQSTLDPTREALHHPSFVSSEPEYHSSLPSYRVSPDYPSYPGHREKSQSLPTQSSYSTSSLEKPNTLCSIQPCSTPHGFYLPHYPCGPRGPACCAQGPVGHMAQHYPWLEYRPPGPGPRDCLNMSFTQSGYPPPQPRPRLTPPGAPLSLEQRKAFVTYEADSDKHVEEIIKFVALLRHNGFDMHIDVFEQQFRSISTIDFMEKYISEKDYLIIIAISPKYYETVSGSRMSMENDERTVNTVYIHKQLQNEFIQNGSRNFRFIPILFPGAKKCHVPTWLQNTHVYSWPRDRDDILRRLMRVEKYNPPPIGELPTIISIPL